MFENHKLRILMLSKECLLVKTCSTGVACSGTAGYHGCSKGYDERI